MRSNPPPALLASQDQPALSCSLRQTISPWALLGQRDTLQHPPSPSRKSPPDSILGRGGSSSLPENRRDFDQRLPHSRNHPPEAGLRLLSGRKSRQQQVTL